MCLVLPDNVQADERSSFITDMTHAFSAKVYCPGVDIDYESFVKAASVRKLEPTIVEDVRNGVAFLNTDGKMGEKPRKEVMDGIMFATKMMTLDHETEGVESWCKSRSRSLLHGGFIKNAETPPTTETLNKGLDEQFSEMRKSMPMQVSALSKLTNAYRTGMTLNYTYEDKLAADKWSDADKKKLLADVIKAQCSGRNTRMLIDLGYAFGNLHTDENSKIITHLYIDKDKCG